MRRILGLLLLGACGGRSTSPEAAAYLETAIDSLEAVALTRRQVDWPAVREESSRLAQGARTTVETYGAIRHAIAALGDNHSFLQLSDSLAALEAELRAESAEAAVAAMPTSPSAYGSRMRPSFDAHTVGGTVIGVVFMPQGRRDAAFAAAFQSDLARLSERSPCAWIVDLRGNGGGDMWPMLVGLGPLLGEGVVGGSEGADGARSSWIYRGGQAIHRDDASGAERVFAAVATPIPTVSPPPPVAVLHDRGTASSGEAMAISFRGRRLTRSFGEDTYGASTSTRGVSLPDGANMVVAVDVFTDRTGTRYPDGVSPDVGIPSGTSIPSIEADPAIAAAGAWLTTLPACGGS